MEDKETNEEDDFICWLSEDPDDWYSFSDYERIIRQLVHEYNEEACCLGEPLLGILRDNPIDTIVILSELKSDTTDNTELQKRLNEIKWWATLRMNSCHPDNLDENSVGNVAYQEGMLHWNAQEYEKAIPCFEKAALYDNELGYFMLGHIFENGFGLKKDLERAIKYYRQGVENEVAFCELKLGKVYRYGLITPYDDEQGFSLIRRAALHGNAAAAEELSDCYRKGFGCETNPAKADYWKNVCQEMRQEHTTTRFPSLD